MQAIEIIVAVLSFLIVTSVIVFSFIKRKRGKTCCGYCDKCSGCSYSKIKYVKENESTKK